VDAGSVHLIPLFRSRAANGLHALVANHVVQGRVIFPGAGYLEMARATTTSDAALHGVFFLQPLAVEVAGLLVECCVTEGQFEVRSSGDEGVMSEAVVHCSGRLVPAHRRQPMREAAVRTGSCTHAADTCALYDFYASVGLQYGPSYRTLVQAWSGAADLAVARLCRRAGQEGTCVHPADLDDALCVSALASGGKGAGSGKTRLPFAVDDAHLQGAGGQQWAVWLSSCCALVLMISHADRCACVRSS
jgi:hypothetical protein